ncbi:Ig-like domain-containing protein [Paraliomyxa miuraensis]|uniref:Ig-like domain-containing protein n=1 Tax=Paraliomyxa miuraensis TaxID=376150 RepID=UPI002255101B|nr:cadherin-like domain-containing protein [Paraliomyxa miuraensis]MCX4241930.1 FG-GAP-like repeat-containing protein [Paraliomyxa miuraensis]
MTKHGTVTLVRSVTKSMRGLGGLGLGLTLGMVLGACADDATATTEPTEGDPTQGSTSGTESTSAMTTALDSTGSTGSTTSAADSTTGSTTGLDSSGTTAADSTTGEPNLPPLPHDDLYFVREDMAPLVVDAAAGVLVNDVEPDGEGLAIDDFDAMSAAGGTVVMQPDGGFEYTPAADFRGDDLFSYVVRDELGATAVGSVRVSVGAVAVELGTVVAGQGGFVIEGAVIDEESGFAVDGGGDVDGDGLDDLLVTSTLAGAGAGQAWVVFGKADGMPVDLADVTMGLGGFSIVGELPGDEAGHAAAIVDDVDGDGLDDVLLGAPGAGPAGRAYLVHGKADGALVDLADVALGMGGFVLEGEGVGEDAGSSVSAAGDVDGDGLGDLVVGAPAGGPVPGGGRAYVVHGRTETTPVLLSEVFMGIGGFGIQGAGSGDGLGNSVAAARDVNADGLHDLLVGASLANPGGQSNAGRCYVVFGKTNTSLVTVSTLGAGGFVIDGETDLDEACSAVAGLGDVDGDGRADVAVGARYAQDELFAQGRVYVVLGKTDAAPVPLTNVVAGMGGFVVDGEAAGNFVGTGVGAPGDVDGDGFADLLLGTPNFNSPGSFIGRGYVVFGKGDGAAVDLIDLTVRMGGYRLLGQASNDQLGWAVAGAGDVDGDGLPDVIVSANRRDGPAGVDAGRSYVVWGGNDRGVLTHRGGAGDDLLVGGPGIDRIVAGAGADDVHGGGGSDVIYGGAGDDRLGVSGGQFFRIDGGSGHDTLVFDDGGVQLDLAVVSDVALRELEAIDITGVGDNVLRFGLRDLRAMVGPSRTLRVIGDATDELEVDLSGGGFVDLGVAAGVHTWSNGVFTLEVEEPLVGVVMP